VAQRWICGGRVAEADALQRDRQWSGGNGGGDRHRLLHANEVAGTEGGPRWLVGEREGGSQEWAEPRVGSGATLNGVDHLGHAEATVDEAEIEFQVGDEGPHCHSTADGLCTALPYNKQDASTHERRVDRPESATQAHQGQVGVGLLPRQRVDTFYGCACAAEQSEHTDTGQLLLERRGERGVGFA